MTSPPWPHILVITDRTQCAEPLAARAAALFRGGCRWLSVREKDMAPAERLALLRSLIAVAAPFGATIGVHDDLAAAQACRCALHLPAGADIAASRSLLGPHALIGQSCHNGGEIAAARGADYATLSPIFPSASKPGYLPAIDPEMLVAITRKADIPILALGGVTPATLPGLAGTGVGGIAIMGAAMRAPEPQAWFSGVAAGWSKAVMTGARTCRKA